MTSSPPRLEGDPKASRNEFIVDSLRKHFKASAERSQLVVLKRVMAREGIDVRDLWAKEDAWFDQNSLSAVKSVRQLVKPYLREREEMSLLLETDEETEPQDVAGEGSNNLLQKPVQPPPELVTWSQMTNQDDEEEYPDTHDFTSDRDIDTKSGGVYEDIKQAYLERSFRLFTIGRAFSSFSATTEVTLAFPLQLNTTPSTA